MPKVALHSAAMVPLLVARRRAGLTQEALAKLAGLHPDTIRAIEQHRTERPTPETMARIATAVGVTIEAILEFADGDYPPTGQRPILPG